MSKLLRTKEVLKLTGWTRSYLDKLRERGVVTTWQPYPRSWHWFKEEEIQELLNANGRVKKAN